MKRTLHLLAGLFLIGTGLSGCGAVQDVAESVVVESLEVPESTESLERVETPESPEISEKQELILAGIDFDDSILSAVTSFNQSNDNTAITLRDYGDQSGVLSADVLSRVYKDVVDGNIPDMYLMQSASAWPLGALMAQDVFVDLYPFLDDDPVISRDDFFSTVLETVQQDGALYYFPVSYILEGIWGLPEYSDGSRFPVNRISELRQKYPEYDMLFGDLSPMDLISMELSQNRELYVDWETKECDFTSERFLNVLEAAGYLPQYRPSGRAEMMDYAAGVYLLEGRQFFAPYMVSGFASYLMMTEGVEGVSDAALNPYGDNMVSMTLADSEVALEVQNSFAISSKCSNPDAAWQFLRTFLELEYQQSITTPTAPNLPVNVHAFAAETDRLLAEGQGTEAGFDRILEMIESAKAVSLFDMQIMLMIHEEASSCFSGEITPEEAARKIQDRVSTYLAKYCQIS